jgi:Family of unknown function (DUF5706)
MTSESEESGISHKEFFDKALTAAGEWTRYADPKALGVAVFLSFGANDLIRHVRRLFFGFPVVDFPKGGTWLEWWVSVAFLGACLLAALTVIFVSAALFPRLTPKGPASLFYFGSVAQSKDPKEYEQQVRAKTSEELESQIASQVWNVARTADKKHRMTRWAYIFLIAFFICWVIARVLSSFVP